MTKELFSFNGLDGTTGSYLLPPVAAEIVSEEARRCWQPDAAHLDELRSWHVPQTDAGLGPREGFDPCDLSQAGWAVVFARDTDPAVRAALRELLDHRRCQATGVEKNKYREFWGEDGLQPGESKAQFLARHGVAMGPADSNRIPYYLLLVGGADEIPFSVQYQLDVEYAVGRVAFDTVEEYRRYATSVVKAETRGVQRERSIAFFAPQNQDDRATAFSRGELVEPLLRQLATDHGDMTVRAAIADDATKESLVEMLGGGETASVLFTAGHGLGWPSGHPDQLRRQGALVCQEWAGPSAREPMSAEQYVSADDITDDAAVHGLVAFLFATFSAGTPEFDAFAQRSRAKERGRLAAAPMISTLPRRLLGHPGGGALAVAGHVDRAWSYSSAWPGAAILTDVYRSCLERLLRGHPIGSAFEYVNQRYVELSSDLSTAFEDVKYYGRRPDHVALANMWTVANDVRGFVVLGDPAVRLPVPIPAGPVRGNSAYKTNIDVQRVASQEQTEHKESNGPADAVQRLVAVVEKLAKMLEHTVDGLAEFEVVTCSSADLPAERYDPATARIRIVTRSTLHGGVRTVFSERGDAFDAATWVHHLELLKQAQAARQELLRTLGSVLRELLEALQRK